MIGLYCLILIYIFICTFLIAGRDIQKEREFFHYGNHRRRKDDDTLEIDKSNYNDDFPLFTLYGDHYYQGNKENEKYPLCKIWENTACVSLPYPLYDEISGLILLQPNTSWHEGYLFFSKKNNTISHPPTCSQTLGKLIWNGSSFQCKCITSGFFGGQNCDQPTEKLIRENKCRKVGSSSNPYNMNLSTFNPLSEGVCVECSIPNAVPLADSNEPACLELNIEEQTIAKLLPPCKFDALNPSNSSPFNKYIDNYGCSCDYYNGYVEAYIPGLDIGKIDDNILSNACLKIGRQEKKYHRTDLAYYSLQNAGKPLQTHSYLHLEPPLDKLLLSKEELLVDQPSLSRVHKNDWLNRHFPVAIRNLQSIQRLRPDEDNWPVVHKSHLVNNYKRRRDTYPLSAYKLAVGQGFESKHWYEETDNRRLSNAIWGHPIVYGSRGGKKEWQDLCTLNPLGVSEGWYFGVTMLTAPGKTVRLDTRGQFNRTGDRNPHVVAPDYRQEMVDPNSIVYLWFLYESYFVKV